MPQKSHTKPAWEDVDITHHQPLPLQLNKNQQQQQWHHNHYWKQREWQQQQGLETQMHLEPLVWFSSFLFSCSTNHYSLDYTAYYAYRTMTTPHLLPGLCSYSSYQGHQTSKGGTSVEVLLHCPRARSGHTQLALAQGQQRVRPIGQGQGQARANPDPMTIQKKITCFIVLLQ